MKNLYEKLSIVEYIIGIILCLSFLCVSLNFVIFYFNCNQNYIIKTILTAIIYPNFIFNFSFYINKNVILKWFFRNFNLSNEINSALRKFAKNSTADDFDKSNVNGSILVVGGTDGSGTRSVVRLLADLGVTMVVEDYGTYDLHAAAIGGWSHIVKPIIKKFQTTSYNINKFTYNEYNETFAAIKELLRKAEKDSKKRETYVFKKGGSLTKPKGRRAYGVKYGFKAPIAMTLLPVFVKSITNFKFLHVLRDGRDISFSGNHSPVKKYYELMYGNDSYSYELKSIRLWSDWNSGVYNFSINYSSNTSNYNYNFDYLQIHTEDLVSSDINTRFASIYTLAKWVNSTLTNDELCVIANSKIHFLGTHSKTSNKYNITSNYGKWKDIIGKNDELYSQLHLLGQPGLRIFGYEPSLNRYNLSLYNKCNRNIAVTKKN